MKNAQVGCSRNPLEPLLNPNHPLIKLAQVIDWSELERELQPLPAGEIGRPPLQTRLIVGLHYLKALHDESDESVVQKWIENPYWQYFCGEVYFQHRLPCHPTSLVKWRNRVGAEGVEKLLKQVIKTALAVEALSADEVKQVNVDTSVQEKAIAYPTDARLYDKARRALVRYAQKIGVRLRQSYVRVGRRAIVKQSLYAAAKQHNRARKQTKQLRTYLGRVIRDIERKLVEIPEGMRTLLENAKRIQQQQQKDSNKCYSIHAPEVECIGKGKAHKKYEFGCKVALATTATSNWIVAIAACHGNPYDGATLTATLMQVQRVTGVEVEEAVVDRGCRGQQHHPKGVKVLLTGNNRNSSRRLRRVLKRRNAIEPVIGHTKQEHGLGRNYLKGEVGDRINALLAGCGFNLRKLYRFFFADYDWSQAS
jgi:transposase, IS5 family